MNESLRKRLRQLRLSGLAQALDVRLQEAAGHGLNHLEFLELILQDEFNVRQQRLLARRQKLATFRETRTLDPHSAHRPPDIRTSQERVRLSLSLVLSHDRPCSFPAPMHQKDQDLPLVLDGADHLFSLLRGEQVVA